MRVIALLVSSVVFSSRQRQCFSSTVHILCCCCLMRSLRITNTGDLASLLATYVDKNGTAGVNDFDCDDIFRLIEMNNA